jgi:hypothetical protein
MKREHAPLQMQQRRRRPWHWRNGFVAVPQTGDHKTGIKRCGGAVRAGSGGPPPVRTAPMRSNETAGSPRHTLPQADRPIGDRGRVGRSREQLELREAAFDSECPCKAKRADCSADCRWAGCDPSRADCSCAARGPRLVEHGRSHRMRRQRANGLRKQRPPPTKQDGRPTPSQSNE